MSPESPCDAAEEFDGFDDIETGKESFDEVQKLTANDKKQAAMNLEEPMCLPACTADDDYHRNYLFTYYHEGTAGYKQYRGQKCKGCSKNIVGFTTPGKEGTEFKPTQSNPLHACDKMRCGQILCKHIYCNPCFNERKAEIGPHSPRNMRPKRQRVLD